MKNINRTKIKSGANIQAVPITLDDPVIDGLVDDVNYPGLIFRDKADAIFLEVNIPTSSWVPTPTNPGRPDVLDTYLDDIGDFQSGLILSEPVFFPGIIPASYATRVPRRLLTEGNHHFSYKITSGGPGGNESGSPQVPLVIDRTAPYDSIPDGPRMLTLPAGWPGSLTEVFMASHDAAGGVPFGIPDYAAEGADPGDRWRLFDGESDVPVAEGPAFPDRVVRYSRALAEVSDGSKKLQYRLVDVAGNISERSFELPISIALNPAPTLAPAGVRDAVSLTGIGDRLIDRADTAVSSGMFVIIPDYDEDRAIDQFHVRLTTTHGIRELGPYPLGGSQLPYNFHVDFPTLLVLYGTSTGKLNLAVEYAVNRHEVLNWVPTATNIELELEVGGPTNPHDPDPINITLLLPVLTGRGSGKVNELDEDDNGLDADVEVTLWSATPLPSARAFDIVLYYMNEQVDRQPVDPTTAMPGDTVAMTVPWPYIQRHSNGLIPLRYEIAVASTHNRTSSPPQDINVNANVTAFLAPSVTGALPAVPGTPPLPGEIRCGALLVPARNARVFVPPHPLLTQGMIVTVNWTGCSDDAGAMPIAGATGTFPYGPISFQEAQIGFTVSVGPYATYIKPINLANHSRGSVHITYTVPIIGPSPVVSAEAVLLVRGVVAGPAYCDGSPWPT
ncbi:MULTISPECIES: hypothetical protein [unclassified Pseudomonas]|uniref:hypothetical protein n=1 Tax=unclassified Pseudomonas TaxID=196821 RepID=UPI0011EFBA43|nr:MULTISPECIES: hypothetical protein [unclassified Pseudomonas]KAA0941186.1 hypothetical protein FQ182_29220 [Pseudomonas sp. ANT_H4]KAA0945310.1 hypothetical protein FQ186_28580 [Pseudomonas sp. ANT_H14]